MMTPLSFEQLYQQEWAELETLLDALSRGGKVPGHDASSGARAAALYRHACGHLALARERSYPAYIIDRLDDLTSRAHQLIYQQHEFGLERLRRLVMIDFPCAVRAQGSYVAVAAAIFLLPAIVVGLLVFAQPDMILSIVGPDSVSDFERMYSPSAESIGRTRDARTDWTMFGYYIRNNVGVAFQCFAGGLFAGLGTFFFLAYNGAFSGSLAGYLTAQGFSSTFYAFIATHSAFELTAIVIAGGAGLRIGHALLSPGRLTRRQSLVQASREAMVLVYGLTCMLLVAAAIEAFWSSASWIAPAAKYGVAAVCWISVLAYLALQGRHAG
jgi:uncharacterized membrane protein SpoIIM required for sporulation